MNDNREAIAEALKELDFLNLSRTDARILSYLIGRKDPCKSEEIERELHYSQSRVSPSLKKLKDRGYITRWKKEKDGSRGAMPFLYKINPGWMDILAQKYKVKKAEMQKNFHRIFQEGMEISEDSLQISETQFATEFDAIKEVRKERGKEIKDDREKEEKNLKREDLAKKNLLRLIKQHREICLDPDDERIDGEECNISLGAILQYLQDQEMELTDEERQRFY